MKIDPSTQVRPRRSLSSLRRRVAVIPLVGVCALAALAIGCGDDGSPNTGTNGPGTTVKGGNGGESNGGGSGGSAGSANGGSAQGGSSQGGTSSGGDPNADPLPTVTKVDLLLMIDNSASMADKQAVLSRALPDLVGRLATPDCVLIDAAGKITDRQKAGPSGCELPLVPEIAPITDIHIGVITSSLGGHGSDQCNPTMPGRQNNDRAHLLTRSTGGGAVQTWDGDAGFLQWDPQGQKDPPGESNPNKLIEAATNLVRGAGEAGCGFESSLEATYRFLVDPAPPKEISVLNPLSTNLGPAEVTGIDEDLLQQRAEFLRPDSFVAVIVLSDENDCSTVDGVLPTKALRDGQPAAGWTLERNNGFILNHAAHIGAAGGKEFRMKSGTSACATDPDSAACNECFVKGGSGCRDLSREEDNLSLRCWDQKRRFGVDMMYPVQRYIDGFQERQVFDLRNPNGDGSAPLVDNPLFQDLPLLRYKALFAQLAEGSISQEKFQADTARLGPDIATRKALPPRSRRAVSFSAIVGVPWQDLASDPQDLSAGYKRTEDVEWANIRTTNGAPPADPLMRESVTARSGTHPITKETLGLGTPNKINGHEWNSESQDLMFACTLPLPVPRNCGGSTSNCDCTYLSESSSPAEIQEAAEAAQSPLCQKQPGSPYGQLQYAAKAYPGGRFVEVAYGLRGRSVLASVCTPNITDESRGDFGYRPVVSSIIDRLRPR